MKQSSCITRKMIQFLRRFSCFFNGLQSAKFKLERVCDIASFIKTKEKSFPYKSPTCPIWHQKGYVLPVFAKNNTRMSSMTKIIYLKG